MSDPLRPMVMLDFKRVFCAEHLLPYKADWKTSLPQFAMLELFNRACSDPAILAACGHVPATETTKEVLADTDQLPHVLDEFSPLCCHLGDDVMRDVLKTAKEQRAGARASLGRTDDDG